MAASNPNGEQRFWFKGQPFGGVIKSGNTANSQRFWFKGSPFQWLLPPTIKTATLTESVTVTDTVSKQPSRFLTETLSIIDTIIRQAGKFLNELLTIIDTRAVSTPVFKQATVNSSLVASAQTDFPAYVDLSRIGITTLAQAQSVRVYADSGKVTELAREIVSASEMWVKISSLTTTTTIYVDYDGVRADYGVTATYGRNAVWSDHEIVVHLNEASGTRTDSAGNDDLTDNNTVPSATGKIGATAANFTRANSEYLSTLTANVATGDQPIEMELWHKSSLTSTYRVITSLVISVAGTRWFFEGQLGADNYMDVEFAFVNGGNQGVSFTTSTINVADGNWHHIVVKLRNNAGRAEVRLYIDGSLIGTATHGSLSYSIPSNFNAYTLGATRNWSVASYTHYVTGDTDEARLRVGASTTDNYTTTTYNNQNNESSFWGTWTTVSSGTTYNENRTETITIVDVLSRNSGRLLGETITVVDAVGRSLARSFGEAITVIDTVRRSINRALSEVVTVVDTIRVRIAAKILNETIVVVDTLNRSVNRALSEVMTIVDTLTRNTGRLLNEALTLVDTVASTKVTARSFSEIVTVVDTAVVKITARMLAEVITVVDRLNRTPARAFQEALTVVDTMTKNVGKFFAEAVTVVDSIRRSVSRALTETVTVLDTVSRQLGRTLSEVVTVIDTVAAIIKTPVLLTLNEVVTVVDTLRRSTGRLLFEAVTVTDSLVRTINRNLIEALVVVDTFARSVVFTKALNEIVTVVDSVRARISAKMFVEAVSVTDSFFKSISRSLRESILLNDILSFLKAARGFILGRDNDTNTGIGKRRNGYLGRDNDTGTGIGRRRKPQLGRDNDTNTGIGKKLH